MWCREVAPSLWAICLEPGEKVRESLQRLCEVRGWQGANISGIGGLCQVELGFWERERGDYSRRCWDGPFERLSLQGNISLYQGGPFAHLHATLSGPDFQVLGGHLFEGTVTATAEIFARLCQPLSREWNATIGAGLWSQGPDPA